MQLVQTPDRSKHGGLGFACENINLEYHRELFALWARLVPVKGPFFTLELLEEMERCIDALSTDPVWISQDEALPVKYVVVGSGFPGRFSLGGDLNFFRLCIASGDRDRLVHYAKKCVDVLYRWYRVLGGRVTTLALVEGKALGGGFECALSCHYIIADSDSQFAFPEALFNLFPGMGGYSFMARRVGIRKTEEIILRGNQFSAQTLKDYGVVDEVASPGKGSSAVEVFLREHRSKATTRRAIERMRALVMPIGYDELSQIVELWVDFAMNLDERDLRRLDLVIRAQAAELEKDQAPRLRLV